MRRYSKKARKHSRKTKIMKGGAGSNFRINNRLNEIKNNYYLCTTSRYKNPIHDFLRPFGNLDELISINEQLKTPESEFFLNHITSIKKESDKIQDAHIIGSSQFGLYFRFVKKSVINTEKFYERNSVEFQQNRTFVFDIEKLLNYIKQYGKINKLSNNLPLCWFANRNVYGYQRYADCLFDGDITINYFLELVKKKMNTIIHEFVCRIPIPLNETAGFLGKVHTSTIYLNDNNYKL